MFGAKMIYLALLAGLLIRLGAFWSQDIALPPLPGQWLVVSNFVRTEFVQTYTYYLSPNQANLLTGVVLGGQGLGSGFKKKLANTGLTHIVAASGMNISLVTAGVLSLLSVLRIGKWPLRIFLVSGLALFYATLTGFAPPIVRAVIMAVFILIGESLGRPKSGYAGLLLAAYLMLWVRPRLLTEASFLLSFAAMAGQVYLGSFSLKLPKIFILLADQGKQSLMAILFTLPIVIIFFSRFSLVALVTNVLVLWTVEPLMILGGVIGLASFVFTPISQVFSWPAAILLEFFLTIVNFFNRPEALVFFPKFTDLTPALLFAAGYYLLLGAVLSALRRRPTGDRL